MNPISPQILGLATMAFIAVLVIAVALRKQPRPIRLFALALTAVGLGYLATTTAPSILAQALYGKLI